MTPCAARIAVLVTIALCARLAAADDMEGNAVFLPMPAGEALTVRNPLGAVRLRGWERPEVRIVAEKRARSGGLLDRLKVRVNLEGGRLDVTAGVYLADDTWHPVPLDGARINLTIDAPREMTVLATTFSGEIDASGFRSGARLASEQGEIRAADITGPVDTRSLDGKQSMQGIHGRLAMSGVAGDIDLESIDGETVDATVYRGQITAREVRAPVVRLRTTVGTILFVGPLRAGGRYELRAHDGDLRLVLRPSPFRLLARARAVRNQFALDGVEERPGLLRGQFNGGGASLELVSANGEIRLDKAP
ncbi:MAG: hypothetical protein EXR72_12315 [Myxococcales bacterium]|nr:hypothetical protein [Myxococcales bacterium]